MLLGNGTAILTMWSIPIPRKIKTQPLLPMLKNIDASQLKVGMYIHNLSGDWMIHPFVRNRLLLKTEEEIRKIVDAGIHDVVIDCSRGLDVDHAPTVEEKRRETEAKIIAIAEAPVAP